jgi:nuclear receptor subfamily 0 group A
MSKSGSRYGRRSNWFKIHCLLQEQQQAQAANSHQKPSALSPNSLNLMRHPSYSSNLFSRPLCTKEELMMLRLDDYAKHSTAVSSPSISSPDSHNSDSSFELGDKRNLKKHDPNPTHLQQQQQQQNASMALNKDLFLQLPFAGFPLMPPPGFMPPSHFLFSNYHSAFYEQNHLLLQQQVQQGLLKTSDSPLTYRPKSSSPEHNENNCDDSDMDDDVDVVKSCDQGETRRFIEEKSPPANNGGSENDDVLTPPRSPKSPSKAQTENNPIDLSIKSGSSTKSDDINHNFFTSDANNKSQPDGFEFSKDTDTDSGEQKSHFINKMKIHCHSLNDGDNRKHFKVDRDALFGDEERYNESRIFDDEDFEREAKRKKSLSTLPLDLTTKA